MARDYEMFEERRKPNPEITSAAWAWLTQPHPKTARTAPVIEIVAALLQILTDPDRRDEDKFDSLRRAVRLLSAFVAGKDAART